jgi:hypothetical protein
MLPHGKAAICVELSGFSQGIRRIPHLEGAGKEVWQRKKGSRRHAEGGRYFFSTNHMFFLHLEKLHFKFDHSIDSKQLGFLLNQQLQRLRS